MNSTLEEPWASFLDELDTHLSAPVELHCCGGFCVVECYGRPRTTQDIDFISMVPFGLGNELLLLAGQGSVLHRKYGLYLHYVAVMTCPDDYDKRLIPLFPGRLENIKLFALEAHDLALSKLERHNERDAGDVSFMAHAGLLNPKTLKTRYEEEMRAYIGVEERTDLTLKLWLRDLFPPSEENTKLGPDGLPELRPGEAK